MKRLLTFPLVLTLLVTGFVATSQAQLTLDEAKISGEVQQFLQENAIPGAVVLIRKGDQQWQKAFGVADLKTGQAMQTDMAFRIGSNTKTMTATVVLQLVQQGKLKLDEPVSKYFQNVPNGDQITIADLLEMRSGIPTYSDLKSVNQVLDEQPKYVYTPQELIQLGIEQKPLFKPGTEFNYSNTNYVMLGVLIEQKMGMSLEQAFYQNLFEPLKLNRTLLPASNDDTMPAPFAHGYLFGTNVSTLDDPALPADEQKAALAGKLLPNDVTFANPSWAWAAGGAISTADQLATYVEALVNGGLLDQAMQKERLASLKPTNPDLADSPEYGLGIVKLGPMLGHDGSLPGYQSFMGHDPETGITLIVWTNLQTSPNGGETANGIAKLLIKHLGAK
ncbi:serine hydrolase domain-containing protein [Bremerella cremea]|nr:serine hydrolase domain-containing protein [Bremerella cremea]